MKVKNDSVTVLKTSDPNIGVPTDLKCCYCGNNIMTIQFSESDLKALKDAGYAIKAPQKNKKK